MFSEETTFICLKTFVVLLKTKIFSNKYKNSDIKKSMNKMEIMILLQWPSDSVDCVT